MKMKPPAIPAAIPPTAPGGTPLLLTVTVTGAELVGQDATVLELILFLQ
jgi:hypothetical protein